MKRLIKIPDIDAIKPFDPVTCFDAVQASRHVPVLKTGDWALSNVDCSVFSTPAGSENLVSKSTHNFQNFAYISKNLASIGYVDGVVANSGILSFDTDN